jgi:hypothetical protein
MKYSYKLGLELPRSPQNHILNSSEVIYQIFELQILKIAERTRTLEIIGFSLSLIALVISLFIFYRFR